MDFERKPRAVSRGFRLNIPYCRSSVSGRHDRLNFPLARQATMRTHRHTAMLLREWCISRPLGEKTNG